MTIVVGNNGAGPVTFVPCVSIPQAAAAAAGGGGGGGGAISQDVGMSPFFVVLTPGEIGESTAQVAPQLAPASSEAQAKLIDLSTANVAVVEEPMKKEVQQVELNEKVVESAECRGDMKPEHAKLVILTDIASSMMERERESPGTAVSTPLSLRVDSDSATGWSSGPSSPDNNTPRPEISSGHSPGKRRRAESDLDMIDALPIDPNERRKERNRRAQRNFRARQKTRIAELEKDVDCLREKVTDLELKNAELRRQNDLIKTVMERVARREL